MVAEGRPIGYRSASPAIFFHSRSKRPRYLRNRSASLVVLRSVRDTAKRTRPTSAMFRVRRQTGDVAGQAFVGAGMFPGRGSVEPSRSWKHPDRHGREPEHHRGFHGVWRARRSGGSSGARHGGAGARVLGRRCAGGASFGGPTVDPKGTCAMCWRMLPALAWVAVSRRARTML